MSWCKSHSRDRCPGGTCTRGRRWIAFNAGTAVTAGVGGEGGCSTLAKRDAPAADCLLAGRAVRRTFIPEKVTPFLLEARVGAGSSLGLFVPFFVMMNPSSLSLSPGVNSPSSFPQVEQVDAAGGEKEPEWEEAEGEELEPLPEEAWPTRAAVASLAFLEPGGAISLTTINGEALGEGDLVICRPLKTREQSIR